MKEVKKEVKKTTAKKTTKAAPKATVKKTKPVKEKPTTTKKTRRSLLRRENKLKATRLSFLLTIIAIFACVACAVIDASNDNYITLPLYGIILFIIMVEDKK